MNKITWKTNADSSLIGVLDGVETFSIKQLVDKRFCTKRLVNIEDGDGDWLGNRMTIERAKDACELSAEIKNGK